MFSIGMSVKQKHYIICGSLVQREMRLYNAYRKAMRFVEYRRLSNIVQNALKMHHDVFGAIRVRGVEHSLIGVDFLNEQLTVGQHVALSLA